MPLTTNILQSLFNKTVSVDEAHASLLQTAEQHPYFTAAQFFLLQQTSPYHPDYTDQAAKTAVLFNNPFWLNLKLKNFSSNTINEPIVNIEANNIAPFINEATQIEPVIETSIPEETIMEENIAEEIVTETPAEEITVTQTADDIIDSVPEEEAIIDENDQGEELPPMKIDLKLSEINPTEDTIAFEPLHTTDYFASQGIKLSEEVSPNDKLGKQLKSFTEWLKVMKKVHTESTIEANPTSDEVIQSMAEKSNTEDAVLTEAMAEVLIQQGKLGKAREVYKKLSLLNPSKSAYFAAKIEQLKG